MPIQGIPRLDTEHPDNFRLKVCVNRVLSTSPDTIASSS